MASLQAGISYGTGRINVGGPTAEVGARFHVTSDTSIVALGWYRSATGTGIAPEIVRLWRESDTTELGRLTSVPDDGTVGWQSADLATPIAITAGTVYTVAGYFPGAGGQPSGSGPVTPDSPFVFESNVRAYLLSASGYPLNHDNGSFIGMDAFATSVGPGDGGGSDETGTHAEWFSSDPDTNTHHDDLPWRTDANVTTLKGEAEGASGFAAIKGVVDTIAASVGTGLRTAVTTLTTNLATANAALVHAATTWSDALAAALQAMSDDFASFGASKPAQGGGDFGTGTFPSNVGTLVWTMLAETDFVECLAWDQPADVYVLSITTRPIGLPLNLTCGVHTIYRCGWWTPLNGSFGRQRSYIDFEDSHLAIGAERMPGVLVSLQPGGEGHIQAWALT